MPLYQVLSDLITWLDHNLPIAIAVALAQATNNQLSAHLLKTCTSNRDHFQQKPPVQDLVS